MVDTVSLMRIERASSVEETNDPAFLNICGSCEIKSIFRYPSLVTVTTNTNP